MTRRDEPDKPPLWGIERRDGELIGCIELRPESDPPGGTVGFWIGKPFWGSGYAGEALAAVVDYAFDELGLPRVEASARPENRASIRVQEKLGFRLRRGAESFFIEHEWARLPAIFDHETREPISNVAYNARP